MSLNVFWFLPTHGDGRYLGSTEGARHVDYSYLQPVSYTHLTLPTSDLV